ncbi:MAG: hypothetical protein O2836_06805 [Proteobacteria bacterium]|nr:hypothetical protein [Pseudomonadota bacterium]
MTPMLFFAFALGLWVEHAYAPSRSGAWRRWWRARAAWWWQQDAASGTTAWLWWVAAVVLPALVATVVASWHGLITLLWVGACVVACVGWQTANEALHQQREAWAAQQDASAEQLWLDAALPMHRLALGSVSALVLGWALGLGPGLMVGYRLAGALASQAANQPGSALADVANRAWYVVDYLPSRLTVLVWGAMGNFGGAWAGWQLMRDPMARDHTPALGAALAGALQAPSGADAQDDPVAHAAQLMQAESLLARSMVCWLALLALVALLA